MKTNSLLLPLSPIYRAAVGARRRLYENGWFKSFSLEAPTVSVGNITVGGTGKTPLVAFVARVLAADGHKVCVLTRGYKRENESERILVSDGRRILADVRKAGDEPFLLAQSLLGKAAVVADRKRFEAGIWAQENLNATAFVLDDAFQHWRLKRDLDILTIDATNPFGNRRLLPAGILREPLSALKRADCVVITRADLNPKISDLKSQIKQFNSACPILLSNARTTKLENLTDFLEFASADRETKLEDQRSKIKNQKSLAFCGLGNPAGFFENLRLEGFQIAATKSFRDHYAYKHDDVAEIEKAARANGAQALLTTAKDAVKLKNLRFDLPCFVAEIEIEFDDAAQLLNLLRDLKTKGNS